MLTISPFRLWEEWINVCVGVWLIVASWLLNVSSPSAKINFVVVGALVVILAVYKLWNGAVEKQGAIGRLDF
jgi:hypothetical protein